MKNTVKNLTALVVMAFVMVSFTTIKLVSKQINTSESSIVWVGKKITGQQHTGTIKIKEGDLKFKKDQLVGGSILVDMTSITSSDLEGSYKDKLEGHLKSADFFGVEKFGTSSIVFTKVTGKNGKYEVIADLTIKGITESVSFDLLVSNGAATTSLIVDRTKFGVKYGSTSFFDNLKDQAINDDFELEISLSL